MADIKANTGRILLGTRELMYCEGIEVTYDFGAIEHYAADRQYPLAILHGNSKLNISVDCAEYNADEQSVVDEIANNGLPVTVELLPGIRGGGIPATTYTNCVVTEFNVTSRQGEIVKARASLSKQSDS